MGYKRVASQRGDLVGLTLSCIRDRIDFAGGKGTYNRPGTFWGRQEGNRFAIYSYSTVVAFYADGEWYMTRQKYSSTTGRHQGLIRRALLGEEVNVTSIELY